jgi:hypothetical protein
MTLSELAMVAEIQNNDLSKITPLGHIIGLHPINISHPLN